MMWVWDDTQHTLLNLATCGFLTIHPSDVGFGIMAHREQRDMGVLLRVCDTEDEARSFIGQIGARMNGGSQFGEPRPAFE